MIAHHFRSMGYLLKDKQAMFAQSQWMWLQNKTQQNKS